MIKISLRPEQSVVGVGAKDVPGGCAAPSILRSEDGSSYSAPNTIRSLPLAFRHLTAYSTYDQADYYKLAHPHLFGRTPKG
jgi:hypothetical protein